MLLGEVQLNVAHHGCFSAPSVDGRSRVTRLGDHLHAVGLHGTFRARSSARAALAEQMPVALVAHVVGMSNSAGDEWAKAVGAARGTYVGVTR